METGAKWKMLESVPRAVFVIVINRNMVLFVRHGEGSGNPAGTYGLPGGKIELHEDPRQTAVRELFEETGIIALSADITQLGSYSTDIETKNGMEPWTVELYLCKRFEGQIRQREKSEARAWLRIADVLDARYQMPRMSREYLQVITKILRDQSDPLC